MRPFPRNIAPGGIFKRQTAGRLDARDSKHGRPSLPPGVRVYAISDIHGRADLLAQMFIMIDADLARLKGCRPIHVFLGDYVDRGPDSRRTLDLLIERSRKHESIFLRGNHETVLLNIPSDPSQLAQWTRFGGVETMLSYGFQPLPNPDANQQIEIAERLKTAIPAKHWNFLRALKLGFLCGDFFFVHAGVRPGIRIEDQQDQDMIWIRDEFLESDADFGKFVVHGHTPVPQPDIRHNRINIDTGAYATGNLTLLTIYGSSMLTL